MKLSYAITGPDGGYWHGYNGISIEDSYSDITRNANPTTWDNEQEAKEEIERAQAACEEWKWFDGNHTKFTISEYEIETEEDD